MACFSDIHGNLPALEAVLSSAEARGAQKIVSTGDLTGYGPFPGEVCRLVEERRILSVVGNYDQKVMEVLKRGPSATEKMNPKKAKILLWTVAQVDGRARAYLASLPDRLTLCFPGRHTLLAVHGSPLSTDDAIYPSITRRGLKSKLSDSSPDILVCGHTHIPFVKRVGGTLIVNCGSAGHPVDGDPHPAYALIQIEKDAVPRARIVRFEYDRDRTISALKETSLPKGLRRDFSEGTKMRFLN